MPTSTYDLIASNTLSTPTGTITFSSIPNNYRDLVLVTEAAIAQSFGVDFIIRFNGDTGTNYFWRNMLGLGGGNFTSQNYSSNNLFFMGCSGESNRTAHIINIFDYTNSRNKVFHAKQIGVVNQATGHYAGRWNNSAALNSITITNNGGPANFIAGSSFSLYGIVS